MIKLNIDFKSGIPPRILCLGAHCDDIEIGCGGTLMQLMENYHGVACDFVIFCTDSKRLDESRSAASRIAGAAGDVRLHSFRFRDGYLPYEGAAAKDALLELSARLKPDVVFTHWRGDAHQDHRLVSELTWNLFRDHLIFEYEIPKYDGDLDSPNVYVPLPDSIADRKVDIILESFVSQANKHWFSEDTFRSLMRLRGLESGREHRYAEAFYCRKSCLSPSIGN